MNRFALLLLVLPGCGLSEADFIGGAAHDPCMANIPVCQTVAGCSLTEVTYIEGEFPGSRAFVVQTPADTTITVSLFWKTMLAPGQDTEILWYEPGCSNFYQYESRGDDLFEEAGSDRAFSRSQLVRGKGDHLIEVYSDATTHYFLRVELDTP